MHPVWSVALGFALLSSCLRSGFEGWDSVAFDAAPVADAAGLDRTSHDAGGADAAHADAAAADAVAPDGAPVDGATGDRSGTESGVPVEFVPTLVGGAEIGSDVLEVAVNGTVAVLATSALGAQLRVLDITTPAAPVELAAVPASCSALHGLTIAGNLLYAVGAGTPPMLEIFDLSRPAAPRRLGGAAIADVGYGVRVSGSNAYVVSESGGDDFEVFDISDPAAPLKVAGLNLQDTYYVRGIDLVGTIAYTVGASLSTIDVSQPSTPVVLDQTGWSEGFYWYGEDVQVEGTLAYAIESNNGGGPQFHVYDVTDPTRLVTLGRIYATNSYLRDLHVVGHHAFVAADDWNDFFDVIDVTDPMQPRLEQSIVLRVGSVSLFATPTQVFAGLVANDGNEFEIYELRAP